MTKMECPIEPDQSECCNSGCNPCIFDVYEQQLRKYKQQQFSEISGEECQQNCLKPLKYIPFKVIDIKKETPQGNIYVFECNLHSTDDENNCNVFTTSGQHLLLRGRSKIDGSDFSRAYTPIPQETPNKTQFSVLIKLYKNGDMSDFLTKLRIGDITEWRGPYGDYLINYKLENIFMIAQGTGIAPLYAIIKKLLENDACDTRIKLFYCCKDLEEVFLREELYKLLDYWNFKYEVFLSIASLENEVKYKEIIHNQKLEKRDMENELKDLHTTVDRSQVLICGSDNFTASIKSVITQFSSVSIHCF